MACLLFVLSPVCYDQLLLGAELLYGSVFPSVRPNLHGEQCIYFKNYYTYILYFEFCILYLVSCILYPVSCILYPVSCILYLVSCILYFLNGYGYNLFFLKFSCQWCHHWNSLRHAPLLLNVFHSCFSLSSWKLEVFSIVN